VAGGEEVIKIKEDVKMKNQAHIVDYAE